MVKMKGSGEMDAERERERFSFFPLQVIMVVLGLHKRREIRGREKEGERRG